LTLPDQSNELSSQPSALIREEDFAKQLLLARYLAGASLPPSRRLETHLNAKTPKPVRPLTKARRRTKAASRGQKAGDAELAKERAGRSNWPGIKYQPVFQAGAESNDLGLVVDDG
jgi:hypothetical protein